MSDVPSPPSSRRTRLLWLLLPAVAFVVVIGLATFGDGPPEPGDAAPDFEAELLGGGGSLALSELRGTPVILNFWASWCAPCEDEAPILQRTHDEFGDRLHVVGVDIKDARSDALGFVEEFGIEYANVRDTTGKIYSSYGLTGQPETFFIDADGTIVDHVLGELTEEELLLAVEELVGGG